MKTKQTTNILIISYLLIINCLGCKSDNNLKFNKQPVEGYCKSIFINYFENPLNEKRYHPPKIYFNLRLINNSQEDMILTSDNHNITGIEKSNLLLIFDKDTLALYAHYKEDDFILKAQETLEYSFETSIKELKSKFKPSGYTEYVNFMSHIAQNCSIFYLHSVSDDKVNFIKIKKDKKLEIQYPDPLDPYVDYLIED